MTLNELIKKGTEISRRYTTGDIPLYINGQEVDLELTEEGENGDYRIVVGIKKKPQPLPEMRIIDEVEVVVENLQRFHDLLRKGILTQVSVEGGRCMNVSLYFADNHTEAHHRDWLIQDEQERWWVMNGLYHRNMVAQGKLIKAER